jgi:hypothetical protein
MYVKRTTQADSWEGKVSEVRNKPRVFLSHSKRDIAFVQRLFDDLRHCQIDPWLDSEEIRHGQPWLDAIFESGIPTCDCVLVYFTPYSLESAVVKKEIDASLITKLRDKHVLFLPYVCDANVRDKLRSDIRAIQVPEWNEQNYHALLPRVVAEVWRGFMERTIASATDAEKVKRLEAELELGRLKSEQTGVFAQGEDRDFRYIWTALDRWEPIVVASVRCDGAKRETIEQMRVFVRIRTVLPFLAGANDFEHGKYSVYSLLTRRLTPALPLRERPAEKITVSIEECPDLNECLLMFGLIERRERLQHQIQEPGYHGVHSLGGSSPYTLAYTPKLERFKYWLSLNDILPRDIEWSTTEPAKVDQ